MSTFTLRADYVPTGDQPEAIDRLVEGVERGDRFQTLLGVTGSGKTFTMANIIARVGRPTLIIAHNKTLAAQLCNEFREFLPDNVVEYFVSYYDYYQPEAYLAATDTYIEKDSAINEEIDRLRHSATSNLLMRDDVVIVASVSCIYGLGSPEEYLRQVVLLREGKEIERDEVLAKLVAIQYERNDVGFQRGRFRVRGESFEVWPAYDDQVIRVQRLAGFQAMSGARLETRAVHLPPGRAEQPPQGVRGEARHGHGVGVGVKDDGATADPLSPLGRAADGPRSGYSPPRCGGECGVGHKALGGEEVAGRATLRGCHAPQPPWLL